MPTLEWIGKDKVINHHQQVPYRVLEEKYTYNAEKSDNMIIRGDNLEALKALLPKYEGRIKCIYIDPPYNTGNEGWVYDDNVNDPKIRKWLGEVVGKEGEDLSRHDKWLCMMYPRLRLIEKLISKNGVIIISIGYQEVNNLMCLCSSIFATKQVMAITVQTSGGKPNGCFNVTQEYLVVIAPIDFVANPLESSKTKYSSPYHGMNLATFNQTQRPNQTYPIFVDNDGVICGVGKTLQERIDSGEYIGKPQDYVFDYDEAPVGTTAVWPVTDKGEPCVWRLIPSSLLENWSKGYIKVVPINSAKSANSFTIQYLSAGIIEKIENGELSIKKSNDPRIPTVEVIDYKTAGTTVPTIMTNNQYYTTHGGNEIRAILGDKSKFTYPKPEQLIEDILQYFSSKDDIILDSFAGSGTTAHAILKLNKLDGGNRRFILVEMMDYAESVTAERVKCVIDGYSIDKEVLLYNQKLTTDNLSFGDDLLREANAIVSNAKGKYSKVSKPKIVDGYLRVIAATKESDQIDGTGGDFTFYDLGDRLLLPDGNLNEEVDTAKIREYVWYMETKTPLTKTANDNAYYLGCNNNTGYYFFYEKERITTLGYEFLATIKEKAESYLIYADLCTIPDEELKKHNITFKKIPRDIAKL